MFKVMERSVWEDGDPYTKYKFIKNGIIENHVFKKAIESLNGYVYNTCVGVIDKRCIFNGYTWISIHGTGSYDANDILLKRFENILRKEIECV